MASETELFYLVLLTLLTLIIHFILSGNTVATTSILTRSAALELVVSAVRMVGRITPLITIRYEIAARF